MYVSCGLLRASLATHSLLLPSSPVIPTPGLTSQESALSHEWSSLEEEEEEDDDDDELEDSQVRHRGSYSYRKWTNHLLMSILSPSPLKSSLPHDPVLP